MVDFLHNLVDLVIKAYVTVKGEVREPPLDHLKSLDRAVHILAAEELANTTEELHMLARNLCGHHSHSHVNHNKSLLKSSKQHRMESVSVQMSDPK